MKKVAIPTGKNNQIEDHFGHCKFYTIYTLTEDNQISNIEQLASEKGCGCKSNIASVLAEKGVQVMLAGGIGAGAFTVLNSLGINVIRGCSGNVDTLMKEYTSNLLTDGGETCGHTHHKKHHCNHA
ncbi:NifB/NifX family molybdenum-iron cluster-binding protein [Aureibaculum sp. A20]|uniref:NifB/NifX family molybdenum-iron cluster-binding protein n=1 Tax=Aureibaculum flavum TaxID=2795986 RepID=A0ABS0WUP5_9FLAO|nr:NifB/NifX family molybdenum-iron cluster-binding protein [Aureibaculum flavum]MBJ2175711.1 NifB/NifX family molybdenum-iron cluster-binding protein [Aureibaculum flavum]